MEDQFRQDQSLPKADESWRIVTVRTRPSQRRASVLTERLSSDEREFTLLWARKIYHDEELVSGCGVTTALSEEWPRGQGS